MKQPAVYIMASKPGGIFYIGVASDLLQRIWSHKNNFVDGLTKKYHIKRLVHYELYNDMPTVILREKRLKRWNRLWKIELVEAYNPGWNDLWTDLGM